MHPAIKQWIDRVGNRPIPTLPDTTRELQRVCKLETAPIQKIVDVVEQDPGLTVHVLRTCNGKDGKRLQKEVVSVQQAIMLVGTEPLANIAANLPVVDRKLHEDSRLQLMRVFCRAYHAGIQAVYWAKQRRDMTPDEVFAATQLHFLGEMILALHAPEELLKCFRLRLEKNIASEEAQYITLGFTFDQLSLAVAEAWHLPKLVIDALHAENAGNPRGFGIMLAVQLARGAAIDWYSDKMHELYKQAADWLELPLDNIVSESHQLAVQVARNAMHYGVLQSAALLPQVRPAQQKQTITQAIATDYQADICLMPQINVLRDTLNELKEAVSNKQSANDILSICLQGMHDGIGLNRVVFACPDQEQRYLTARAVIGADNDPVFSRFTIKLDQPHLFKHLASKPQAVCINDSNRNKYWQLVPSEFQKLIGTNSFICMSVFVNDKLAGIVYADRHTSACQVDNRSFGYFKNLCGSLGQALKLCGKPV